MLTKMKKIFRIIIFILMQQTSFQDCQEEISHRGISVKWPQSPPAINVESEPLCYYNEELVTRNCTESEWEPVVDDISPCSKAVKHFDLASCPPGFYKISENNSDYCYQIGAPSSWNFPCFSSGGASIITDLDAEELQSLFSSLIALNTSRYFWLPAQRQKLFNPVAWYIPGPNWGLHVKISGQLRFQSSFFKNCLALDVQQRILLTDSCSETFPSLCFYINNIHYPAICPNGYHAFRFKPDNGTCYGIEQSDSESGITFNDFVETKCKKPMSDYEYNDLARFIFVKIAELKNLSNNEWCWFKAFLSPKEHNYLENEHNPYIEGIINNMGSLGLLNSSSTLSCMACEADVIYGNTEFIFEYNDAKNKIYLTIYFPSGLWKYDYNDKGIQCFSDAKGFVKVISINDLPLFNEYSNPPITHKNMSQVEKIVYVIDLVTDRAAQYWCEGHTFNFSLITTGKIIVNPKGNDFHVFSLVIKYYISADEVEDLPDMSRLISNVTTLFDAEKVLLMDIYEYTIDHMLLLLHLHVTVKNIYEDEAQNILATFNILKDIAELELPKRNCIFVNISSSLYCLPTTTVDSIILDWELTSIGHFSAPKQFCLQANGLPVNRQCRGSYHVGGVWGDVEGHCDTNITPSMTTTFLYKFVNKQVPSNFTSRFLTDVLSFVLSDINIIIPADIYYLSMSLQQILYIAGKNQTSVDIGDIDNIAWIMNRVMIFNCKYLRLAQTLNSTNVILNSVNDIIEIIAQKSSSKTYNNSRENTYQLAVKPQFLVQISYPQFNNITGIAVSKISHKDNFTEMMIKPLYKNTTLDEVLLIENLEIATWLPTEVLDTLKLNSNNTNNSSMEKEDIHIIITVFQNDAVFQELNFNNVLVNSRIVGISIPGFISNLEYSVPLVFKQSTDTGNNAYCGYWEFQSRKSNVIPGFWDNQGCFLVQSLNNITVCECYHLTHFSQLLTIQGNADHDQSHMNKYHTKALNLITLIGCFLSLAGIVGIWITALVFANWRKKAGTKVLLQLSTAISLPLVFIVVFILDDSIFVKENGIYTIASRMKNLCITLGALLHYSILSSFMWMLITAVLQFIRYVRVLGVNRPSRFMIKFTLIGWGIPLVPVFIVLMLDIENYIPDSSSNKTICYPNGYYFLAGILMPICIILFINVTLFILVLHAISKGPNEKIKSTDIDLVSAQLRLSIFLFFLMGLTWIFGIFSFSNSLVWSYLFCLTSTLQGFVLFIYFIICDPTTRTMWITLMKPSFSTSTSRNSITSLSSS